MTIALRDYQQECLEAVLSHFEARVSRQLITLPTGAGKTIVLAAIAKNINKKTLILAHREELITQAFDKFRLFWPEASIGICMGERDEIDNQIVIGSIQTCSRPKRLTRLLEHGFELMMIDEAHHSVSNSYQSIINELGFINRSNKLLIGVTATPMRGDKQGLGNIFEKITFSRSIGTMIKVGYLSPVVGRKILTNFSFEKIRTHNGDFNLVDLSEAVNTKERNEFIVSKFNEYAKDRKGVAFCVDVQHCKDLSDAFKKAGFSSAPVYGEMPTNDRKNVLSDLKNGKIQIVTSCGILTEGFDEPSIDAVLMARPTKSHGLYVQCIGRGLRLWPGKQNCFVLDFTDRGHNLDSVITLSNSIPEAFIKEGMELEKQLEPEKGSIGLQKSMSQKNSTRSLIFWGSARFMWVSIGNDEWSLTYDLQREIIMQPLDGGYIATLYFPDGSSNKIVSKPLPLEYCSGVCEDYARRYLKVALADMKAPWMNENEPATQGQREYLQKQSAYNDKMTKAEAALEIRKIIALKNKQRRIIDNEPITQMQKYFLISRGIDIKDMTKLQAMQAISKIKQNERVKYV